MDQDLKQQIKEIMGKFECPLDFECLKSVLTFVTVLSVSIFAKI
jgi:hypothetical protein